MKLRIQGNSIRLRLSESDLDAFRSSGSIEESTAFPDGSTFTYGLRRTAAEHAFAQVADGRMIVEVPAKHLAGWTDSADDVFETTFSLAERGELRVKVEMDLPCRHRPAGRGIEASANRLS